MNKPTPIAIKNTNDGNVDTVFLYTIDITLELTKRTKNSTNAIIPNILPF